MHCSKVTIRDARSAKESKKAVLGQPTVSTSTRTLCGSNIWISYFKYSTILLYLNIWPGQSVFPANRK
jgi:hypothetical protein